jgi:hypothetical protein
MHEFKTKQSTGLPPGKERRRRRFRICSVQPEKFNLSLGNVTMWILTVISLKPEEASNQENQLSTRLYMYQAANHVRGHASITYVKPHRYDRDYCITSTAHGPANPR